MNDGLKFTDDVTKTFKKTKTAMFVTAITSIAVCGIGLLMAYNFSSVMSDKIYVVDDGSIMEAQRTENKVQRDLEVVSHVTRFHELFFNLMPSQERIKQNIDMALELADKSAYDYFKSLEDNQHFSRLVNIGATQYISIDTVAVDMNRYPYREITVGTVFLQRPSNITEYAFRSTGELTNVTRTRKNPHGLQLRKFNVEEFRKVRTTDK